jgi:hypothetical protein
MALYPDEIFWGTRDASLDQPPPSCIPTVLANRTKESNMLLNNWVSDPAMIAVPF